MSVEDGESESVQIRLAEYSALRAEILNRANTQHQLVSLAIIAAGTIFIASFQSRDNSTAAALLLAYPMLAMFLAAAWIHNEFLVWQLAYYIKYRIEERLGVARLGWEHYRSTAATPRFNYLASTAIFIGSQVVALIAGMALSGFSVAPLLSSHPSLSNIQSLPTIVAIFLIISALTIPLTVFLLGVGSYFTLLQRRSRAANIRKTD